MPNSWPDVRAVFDYPNLGPVWTVIGLAVVAPVAGCLWVAERLGIIPKSPGPDGAGPWLP